MPKTKPTKNEPEKTKKPLIKSRLLKVLILVLILIGLAIASYSYINKPAEGTITSGVTDNGQTAVLQAQTKTGHYAGSAINFDYPGDYSDIQNNPPSGIIAEQLSLVAHGGAGGTRRLSVTVKQRAAGIIMQEDAAYKLRIQDPTNYTHTVETIGGQTADKFIRQDGSEITYFIESPSYYAAISGTSSLNGQQLPDDMAVVMTSFSWVK